MLLKIYNTPLTTANYYQLITHSISLYSVFFSKENVLECVYLFIIVETVFYIPFIRMGFRYLELFQELRKWSKLNKKKICIHSNSYFSMITHCQRSSIWKLDLSIMYRIRFTNNNLNIWMNFNHRKELFSEILQMYPKKIAILRMYPSGCFELSNQASDICQNLN